MKNKAAQALGKKRWKGKSKKERSEFARQGGIAKAKAEKLRKQDENTGKNISEKT